jgi:hypothetical protein
MVETYRFCRKSAGSRHLARFPKVQIHVRPVDRRWRNRGNMMNLTYGGYLADMVICPENFSKSREFTICHEISELWELHIGASALLAEKGVVYQGILVAAPPKNKWIYPDIMHETNIRWALQDINEALGFKYRLAMHGPQLCIFKSQSNDYYDRIGLTGNPHGTLYSIWRIYRKGLLAEYFHSMGLKL